MSFEPISNIDLVASRVAYQYSNSQNLIDYIKALLTPFDELEVVFSDILNKRLITNATTDALDIMGSIVVQPRGAYDTTEQPWFGLDAADIYNPVYHVGLGDLNDSSLGGILRSIEQQTIANVSLPNASYKKTIKGKEAKNNYPRGTESLLDALVIIFDITTTGMVHVEEDFSTPSDPFVKIKFNRIMSLKEKSFLTVRNILPKAGGIRFEYEDTNGTF